MSKAPKQSRESKVGRSSASGQFLGRTKDGILIPKPDFMPTSFTLRELDKAIRAAKRRQAEAQAS